MCNNIFQNLSKKAGKLPIKNEYMHSGLGKARKSFFVKLGLGC